MDRRTRLRLKCCDSIACHSCEKTPQYILLRIHAIVGAESLYRRPSNPFDANPNPHNAISALSSGAIRLPVHANAAKSLIRRYTSSIIAHYNSISSKSRIKQAVCALLAASATRLKSWRNGAVSGAPWPLPLWPKCCWQTDGLCCCDDCCSGCDVGPCVDDEPK